MRQHTVGFWPMDDLYAGAASLASAAYNYTAQIIEPSVAVTPTTPKPIATAVEDAAFQDGAALTLTALNVAAAGSAAVGAGAAAAGRVVDTANRALGIGQQATELAGHATLYAVLAVLAVYVATRKQ